MKTSGEPLPEHGGIFPPLARTGLKTFCSQRAVSNEWLPTKDRDPRRLPALQMGFKTNDDFRDQGHLPPDSQRRQTSGKFPDSISSLVLQGFGDKMLFLHSDDIKGSCQWSVQHFAYSNKTMRFLLILCSSWVFSPGAVRSLNFADVPCGKVHGSNKVRRGRVIGGSEAKISQFPHSVSLRMNDIHMCGGTMVSLISGSNYYSLKIRTSSDII